MRNRKFQKDVKHVKRKLLSRTHKCSRCGKEFHKRLLQLNHIKQIKDGGDNRDKNVELLCDSCHKEIHKHGGKHETLG